MHTHKHVQIHRCTPAFIHTYRRTDRLRQTETDRQSHRKAGGQADHTDLHTDITDRHTDIHTHMLPCMFTVLFTFVYVLEFSSGPKYLYSRMQGFYIGNCHYDLEKYPPHNST